MRLIRCESLDRADKVLALVGKKLGASDRTDCDGQTAAVSVKVWSNGREQGYCLVAQWGWPIGDSLMVVFAKDRIGDQIVVIGGRWADFDFTTHMPHQCLFELATYCASDDHAAAFIAGLFLSNWDNYVESLANQESEVG